MLTLAFINEMLTASLGNHVGCLPVPCWAPGSRGRPILNDRVETWGLQNASATGEEVSKYTVGTQKFLHRSGTWSPERQRH